MGLIPAPERMSDVKLRQAIALEAARLMYERIESEYFTAKRKAAKRLCRRGVKPEDLPSNAEIREQIQLFARIHEGDKRTEHLRGMRLEALRLMRILRVFRPRLIGSVMTGHVRKGSDFCRRLTEFDLRRPGGAKRAGRLPWDTLMLSGT
jgi:predicted nucleotidyltransferase